MTTLPPLIDEQRLQLRPLCPGVIVLSHWVVHADDVAPLPALSEKRTHRGCQIIRTERSARISCVEHRCEARVIFNGDGYIR